MTLNRKVSPIEGIEEIEAYREFILKSFEAMTKYLLCMRKHQEIKGNFKQQS